MNESPDPTLPADAQPHTVRARRLDVVAVIVLMIGTLILYARVGRFDFINFDDGGYVVDNPRVRAGLTFDSIIWAFTTRAESNWHPLTWLSLMLDVQLFGVHPGAMHCVNALLHTACTALLYVALRFMSCSRAPAFWVAAMFAWHPLHVESVAWISERKDVLSTLFMMLGLIAYAQYVKTPSRRAYLWVAGMLILGLMSKPMLVTFPCVLVLLDIWPLRRTGLKGETPGVPTPGVGRLVVEKLPLFAVVALSAVITYFVQSAGRSVAAIDQLPLGVRFSNVAVAYVQYLQLTVIPRNLAVFYPLASLLPGGRIELSEVVVAGAVLVSISLLVLVLRKRSPWALVGWLWYLGTLVPVIGIVQVGNQSHADRYTYVPLIGIFIAIAWSAQQAACGCLRRRMIAVLGCVSLAMVFALSWRQIGYWRNSLTLMQRAIDVVPNNYLAYASLGQALDDAGDSEAAKAAYEQTLRIRPDDAIALNNLAVLAVKQGQTDEAIKLYRHAVFSDPNYIPAYNNYGNLLMKKGRRDDAMEVYRAGLRRDPAFAPTHQNLALALASGGDIQQAIPHWEKALQLDPRYSDAHASLGTAMIMTGRAREGMTHLRDALRIHPDHLEALNALSWMLATHPSPVYADAVESERLARQAEELTNGKEPIPLDTLAAAQARAGKFDDAIANATRALDAAHAQNQAELIPQIEHRLTLYREKNTYTSGK